MFEIIQKIDWFVYPLGILGILGCLFFVERFPTQRTNSSRGLSARA